MTSQKGKNKGNDEEICELRSRARESLQIQFTYVRESSQIQFTYVRESSQIQLTSQVLPPSGDQDWSMWADLGEMFSQT